MQKTIKKFIVIVFVFSWLVWLPGVLYHFGMISNPVPDQVLLLVGALSPLIAAFYLEGRKSGWGGIMNILKRAFDVRIPIRWLAVCVFLPLIMHGASRFIYSLFEENLPQSHALDNPVALIPLFIIMFLIGGGLNEEIGWRNYVLEYFQQKHNSLISSLYLAFFWILWHLPLFFMSSTNQAHIPYWLFMFPVIPLTIMITWIYNNTGSSIFAVALFHTMGNLSHEIFVVIPSTASPSLTGFIILGIIYSIVAVGIILAFGYKDFAKGKSLAT